MKKIMNILSAAAVVLIVCVADAAQNDQAARAQKLELGSPFLDNMILQREMPVPVWGWAKPGEAVSVSFAGREKTARADENGKWMVKLDPLAASTESRKLAVTAGGESITRQGVLVGEVWFSSGQSNMDWVAGKSMVRDLANQLARSKEDIPIREYNADIGSSLFARSRVTAEGGWKSRKSAGNFSALSLAFAWRLYQELKVPIGILRSTHGATPVETWTPYEGFAAHPKLQDIALKIRQSDPSTSEGRQAYEQYCRDLKQWQIDGEKRIERMRSVGAMDCSLSWIRRDGLYIPRPGTILSRPPLPGIAD